MAGAFKQAEEQKAKKQVNEVKISPALYARVQQVLRSRDRTTEIVMARLERLVKLQVAAMKGNAPPLSPEFYLALMVAEHTGRNDMEKTLRGTRLITAFARQMRITGNIGFRSEDGMGGNGLLQLEKATYDSLRSKYAPFFTMKGKPVPFKEVVDEIFWSIRAEVALMHSNYTTQYKLHNDAKDIRKAAGAEGTDGFLVYMAALHNVGSGARLKLLADPRGWETDIGREHEFFLKKFRRAYFELTGRKLE